MKVTIKPERHNFLNLVPRGAGWAAWGLTLLAGHYIICSGFLVSIISNQKQKGINISTNWKKSDFSILSKVDSSSKHVPLHSLFTHHSSHPYSP